MTSNPAGINCGTTCSALFPPGTTVVLTATPTAGGSFSGWSGGCSGSSKTCSVVVNAAKSVAASFNSKGGVQLNVSENGSGSGTVTSNPPGINCTSGSCSATFPAGTTVTLTAAPNKGSTFGGWSGTCSGASTCSVSLGSAASVTATFAAASVQAINHIILMAQENRGFLEYFGALPQYWAANGFSQPDRFDGLPQFANPPGTVPTAPGCDPTSPAPGSCIYDPQNPVASYHTTNKCTEGLSPWWIQSHHDFNYKDPVSSTPTLDGYVIMAANFARKHPGFLDVNGTRAMGYFTGDDLNYYYFMASNFATSDRWFSPAMSDTATNRMYMLTGTSAGLVRERPPTSPLSNQRTIFEALQDAGISWRVYVTDPPTLTPNPNFALIPGSAMAQYSFSYQGTNWKNFVPATQFITDAQQGTLPQVALIEPGYNSGTDEHPFQRPGGAPGGSVQAGAKYVSTLINALMGSKSWKDSVFFFTFDEFGGFYDYIPPQPAPNPDGIPPMDLVSGDTCFGDTTPPTCDFMYTGYRVPFIVISPFTKQHYVSHTVADHTAILKFIENRFALASLTARDAAQSDITEFFDFANPPWSTPPTPPAQVVTGPCSFGP